MMRGHSVSVDPGESRRAALKHAASQEGEILGAH